MNDLAKLVFLLLEEGKKFYKGYTLPKNNPGLKRGYEIKHQA